jgi:hypothetical protein
MAYDAFISYSHAGDDRLASRRQQVLARFAKPWWRRRSLRTSVYSFIVDPGVLADHACMLVGRNLTATELETFGAVGAPRCRQWP